MSKVFRPYEPEQILLMPASLQEWLPPDHLAYFISDVVDHMELSAIIIRIGSTISTMKDLNGKRVAYTVVGRDILSEFDTIAKQKGLSLTLDQFASYDEAAAAMERGQVQAMLGLTIAQRAYIAQNPERFAFLGKPFTSEQFAVIAKKGDSELIAIVSEVIKELKTSGELLRLAERAGFPVESLALL